MTYNKDIVTNLLKSKDPNAIPLYIVVRGSHAYGTNIESSDVDYSGVYIQSKEDIFGFNYKEQINDDKNDIVLYEIKRFFELLKSNNPTILELLNTPEDCILYKDPIFDEIIKNSDKFITKKCSKSFGGYAIQQIKKAKGLNKKQNWERSKIVKKDILDFCYVIINNKSIPWKQWNNEMYDVKFCGVTNINNAKDLYNVYYDRTSELCYSKRHPKKERDKNINILLNSNMDRKLISLGYKGLVKSDENDSNNYGLSNQLRLSSIPKGEKAICIISYNKDGYTEHCKDYKEYNEWLEKRNVQRYVDVKNHGQKIDGKNMMHCARLLDMCIEIIKGDGINVRRPNPEDLLNIRKGKLNLDELISIYDNKIKEINELFKTSSLPDSIDDEYVNKLLTTIRSSIYDR